MATSYIDINAQNSRLERNTNNVFEYELPEAITLPAGSQISVENAMINLQGITGASIEITETIEETILFQYYMSDSTYQVPWGDISSAGNELSLFFNMDIHSNTEKSFGPHTNGPPDNGAKPVGSTGLWDVGYTENIMPLTVQTVDDNGDQTTYPFCGRADIKISPGVYSISKLATLISDQINGRETVDNDRVGNIQIDKLNKDYNGTIVNNTMNRSAKVEKYIETGGADGQYGYGLWDIYLLPNQIFAQPGIEWWSFANIVTDRTVPGQGNNVPLRRPFTSNDNTIIPTVVAVTSETNDLIRKQIIKGDTDGYFSGQNLRWEDFVSPYLPGSDTLNPDARYNVVYQTRYKPVDAAAEGAVDGEGGPVDWADVIKAQQRYDLFDKGMSVGATGFNINYDTTRSAFSVQKAHETRRKPTHDRYGNSLANPGVGITYLKNLCNDARDSLGPDPADPTDPTKSGDALPFQISSLKTLIQRYSGVCIYNWAFQTCLKKGINWADTMYHDTFADDLQQFVRFDEFFTTREEAIAAWDTTVWARLGFQYDDIQSPSSFTEQVWYDKPSETTPGFTTRNQMDSSAIPFMSSLYNPATITASTLAKGDKNIATPAVNGVQMFNLLGINTPYPRFSNASSGTGTAVAQYQSSFYNAAIMFPVETKELDVVATGLPTLSENGYLYILSNLVDQNDIVKFKDNVGLLDLVPKSNLSNQDFISDRTSLTHTVSNEKIFNSIRIQILNPDLTNVALQSNSSILLKITRPQPKETVLLNTIQNNMSQNAMAVQVQNEVKEEQKAPAGSHKMPDGTIMKDKDHKKKEPEKEKAEKSGDSEGGGPGRAPVSDSIPRRSVIPPSQSQDSGQGNSQSQEKSQ